MLTARSSTDLRVVSLMIVAEVLAMLGSSSVAATLPALTAEWHLSSAQAGTLSGAYFFGYAAAVPILVSLTDRVDARLIFAFGAVAGIAANVGFGLFARGFGSATALWTLAGVSLAGVYMPALRIIIDRVAPVMRLRAVPYYTASFGVGISASFLVTGIVAQNRGWRVSFVVAGAGCFAALACSLLGTVGTTRGKDGVAGSGAFAIRAVLRNAAALRYILAYGGHCWELFALRAWLVALLLFVWNKTMSGDPGRTLTYWSSLIALAGVPSSIIGAEWALRVGRRKLVSAIALASVAIAVALAWLGTHWFVAAATGLVLYNIAIFADSGAITAGLVEAADAEILGSSLALHSLVGFVAGALGPIAVGIALNAAGGPSSQAAWPIALLVMAAGSAIAFAAVLRRSNASSVCREPETLS